MRLVYPTDENMGLLAKRGAHFGKANFYTIVTLEDDKIVDVEGLANPGHTTGGCGNAVANIMQLDPSALIVAGIGGSPAQGFADAGLDVYADQVSPTVQDSVTLFLQGKLNKLGQQGTCSVH